VSVFEFVFVRGERERGGKARDAKRTS